MKNRKGFTLIELMIVVAIIGILAALAIPDFMKMLAKSKQSEAKTNLGSVFNLETAYKGEHNVYGETFNQIGFAPEGENVYTYSLSDAATDCAPADMHTDECSQIQTHPSKAGGSAENNCTNTGTVTANAFTCLACGNVDSDDFIDIWSVDGNKDLANEDGSGNKANDVNQ